MTKLLATLASAIVLASILGVGSAAAYSRTGGVNATGLSCSAATTGVDVTVTWSTSAEKPTWIGLNDGLGSWKPNHADIVAGSSTRNFSAVAACTSVTNAYVSNRGGSYDWVY